MRRYSQDCPIARTLDIVGDRWTLLIVRDLFMGHTRFSDFLESCRGLPPKVLSARLKLLMEHGVIAREIYSQHPLRAEYRLTEKGRTLLPVMLAFGTWGLQYLFEDEPELKAGVARAIHAGLPEARESLEEGGFV